MKIGIIGAGRAGSSVAKYISLHAPQHSLSGFYSRHYSRALESADFCNTKAFTSLNDLVRSSDTLFIATQDCEIGNVWECIDKDLIKNKFIGHFSGSLSSDVLGGAECYGAYTGSIHPMYAFSDRFNSYKRLDSVVFTAEGCNEFLVNVVPVFKQCGNTVCVIDKQKKALYHASASMASNHLIGLLGAVADMLLQCGFEKDSAYKLLAPLMKNNLENALQNGVEYALTGPIERGDVATVEKHLSVLNTEQTQLYKQLAKQVVKVAQRKNSEKQLAEKYSYIQEELLK